MSDPLQSYRPPPPKEKVAGATALLDESFHRLRSAPLGVLGVYYAGSLPFVLALLYFWGDLTHGGAAASGHSTGEAFGLTLLFLWMKTCHALFARRLRDEFNHRRAVRLPPRALLNLLVVQGTVHSVGLFVLAIASFLTLPFGWAYAFCQSATALGAGEKGTVREILRRSWSMSLRWPKQNHLMLLIMSLLGLFVWINLMLALLFLPYAAKLFTGEENMFTRSGAAGLNSTFFTVTLCLAYLVLDPVVKTFYTLRCFYAESLHTGEDIKGELRALPPVRTTTSGLDAGAGEPSLATGTRAVSSAATASHRAPVLSSTATALALLCALLGCLPSRAVRAETASGSAASVPSARPPALAETNNPVRAPELDKSIEEVMRRREFAWRLPPAPEPEEVKGKNGLLDNIVRWLRDVVAGIFRQIGRAFSALREWWRELWKKWFGEDRAPASSPERTGPGVDFALLKYVVYALAGVLAAVLVYYVGKQYRRGRQTELAGRAASPGIVVQPDLSDDAVVASQLPEDEWLQLARRLLDSGEHRLALRAFYLSILALLSTRGLLAIARHKSNRDYQAELRRRARDRAELQSAFSRNVGRYERVWYGPHAATSDLFEQFLADRQVIADAAQAAGSAPPALA